MVIRLPNFDDRVAHGIPRTIKYPPRRPLNFTRSRLQGVIDQKQVVALIERQGSGS